MSLGNLIITCSDVPLDNPTLSEVQNLVNQQIPG